MASSVAAILSTSTFWTKAVESRDGQGEEKIRDNGSGGGLEGERPEWTEGVKGGKREEGGTWKSSRRERKKKSRWWISNKAVDRPHKLFKLVLIVIAKG